MCEGFVNKMRKLTLVYFPFNFSMDYQIDWDYVNLLWKNIGTVVKGTGISTSGAQIHSSESFVGSKPFELLIERNERRGYTVLFEVLKQYRNYVTLGAIYTAGRGWHLSMSLGAFWLLIWSLVPPPKFIQDSTVSFRHLVQAATAQNI